MKKAYVATMMAAVMAGSTLLGGCSGSSTGTGTGTGSTQPAATESQKTENKETASAETEAAKPEIEKPEKITLLIDGTFPAVVNGQKEWVAQWEDMTGIELEVIQPDHSAYYDVLGQTLASGPENWPDVILASTTYYVNYAAEGVLWDMTDAWENSDLRASGRVVNEGVFDSLYSDGRLYGLPVGPGSGCMTYIRKNWLDNVGLDVPTTYDEYIEVLKAFSQGDPDGNGIDGDTYGVSAAGFINNEAPYVQYLPEFYQDAYPTFYQKEDGTWVDGFTEDSMKAAIQRIKDAYAAGYLEPETLTNQTSDCRNKFYENKFGVFTYWTGNWRKNLRDNLVTNGEDGNLIPLPPIKEVGAYIDRTPIALCITSACKNPEGVFKYFLEDSLDGGEMQKLWTYGVEGFHWSTEAETLFDVTYEEGEFHMLESKDKPGSLYYKAFYDDSNPLARFEGEDPGINTFDADALEALEIFNANCKTAPLPATTEEMSQYNGDLTTLKYSIIADCVTQGLSVEDGYKRFEAEGGAKWSQMIVDSLNSK